MSQGTHDWQYAERLHLLRLARGGKCQRCPRKLRYRRRGRVERWPNLEFAHLGATELKGEGRGLRRRFLDIRDNPELYLLLCKLCHRSLDANRGVGRRVETEEEVPF